MYNAEVMIYEIALLQNPSASPQQAFGFRRTQYLHACLEASKSVVENFLSCDGCMSFYVIMHCMHGFQILHRLSILDDPEWDCAAARQVADVMGHYEQLVTLFENLHARVVLQTGAKETVWSRGAEKLKIGLPEWRAGLDQVPPIASISGQDAVGIDPMLSNLADDSWLTDIFSTTAWNP